MPDSPEQTVAELLTEMDLPVWAPAWTPQQAATFLRKLSEAGWSLVRLDEIPDLPAHNNQEDA